MLGTNKPVNGGFGRAYMDPATETPEEGTTEVWQIVNLTGDSHPIHFHLVNVQLLGRQPFDEEHYNGTPHYTGPAQGPLRTELGWKETVRMNPGRGDYCDHEIRPADSTVLCSFQSTNRRKRVCMALSHSGARRA